MNHNNKIFTYHIRVEHYKSYIADVRFCETVLIKAMSSQSPSL